MTVPRPDMPHPEPPPPREVPASPPAATKVRYWDPWLSVCFTGVILLLAHWLLGAFIEQGIPRMPWFMPSLAQHPPALETWLNPITTLTLVTLLKVPMVVALLTLFVRLRGETLDRYLGLRLPGTKALLRWIGLLLVVIVAMDVLRVLLGHDLVPNWMVQVYRGAPSLTLLALAFVVAAPAWEELAFRGFLLPGLARSRLGAAGAVLLTSALFAVLHLQYNPYDMFSVFVLGALLGAARMATGSTSLAILLHAVVNLIALIQVSAQVEGLFS